MIKVINWNNVDSSIAPAWFSADQDVVAIWPSPVDYDECFRLAGFDSFDDSDDRWDADFEDLAARLVGFLKNRLGTPTIRSQNNFADQREPTIIQRVLAPTINDNFDDFVADFGPCRLRTGMGHPIFWLSWPRTEELSIAIILNAIEGDIPTIARQLDWTHLVPGT